MFFKTLRDLARPQIVAIFDVLKRSDGLAVGDLAEALKMSYMGVKQYCIELEQRGYLDTWRRAKETGRPELTYRLTAKAQVLFPQHSNELSLEILDAVRQLHGPTAAEKILYQYFLKKSEAYSKRIKGKTFIERATSLAKLRDAEAHCAQVDYDPRHGLRLTEFHSPLADLIKAYPTVAKMEESMLSRLLQAPVQREMSAVSGLMRITFLVAGATMPPPAPPSTTVRTRVPAKRPGKATATAGEEAPDASTLGGLMAQEILAGEARASEAMPADTIAVDTIAAETMAAEAAAPAADVAETGAAPAFSGAMDLGEAVSDQMTSPLPVTTDTAPAIAIAIDIDEDETDDPTLSSEAGFGAAVPTADFVELETPAPTAERPPVAPTAADLSVARLEEEPLLFTPPIQAASPRHPTRTVAPARSAAKAAEPVAEELFLSL